MKKFFAWMNDVNGWALLIIVPLALYMLISAFFPLHNFYSVACQSAGWFWRIAGVIIIGGGCWLTKKINNDFWFPIAVFVVIAMGFCAFTGFNF